MSTTNAQAEFLKVTKPYKVIGAIVQFGDDYLEKNEKYVLPLLYTQEEYDDFLKKINKEYDAGYGGQELFGVIVCENGVWMDRGEYDGSEWWNTHIYPNLAETFGEKEALKYERFKKLKRIDEK